MKTFTKALVGTVAAGAMAVSTAGPAYAGDRDDGIGAGEIIAGALIIGGIAAVAASSSKDRYRHGRDYRYDRGRYGYGGYGMGSREAVSQCVRAAERDASRYSYGRADVTEIRNVDRKREGYNVKGRIVVNDGRSAWHRRGWSRDRYDSGSFTCKVRYGRIADIDYSGLRGLR